jgi:hypothetical protein
MTDNSDTENQFHEILATSFFLRTTMRRRKSGGLRTIETTYVWDGDRRMVISGYPGPRDWVANMGANGEVTVSTVEGDRWFETAGTARVVRDRNERVPHLIAFIENWAERPGFPRRRFMFIINAIKINRKLHLPWWGPFYFVRKVLDQMPCVEITFTGEITERRGPEPMSEPQTDRP